MTITYTTITPSSSTETITITKTVASSDDIHVTASSTSSSYVLDPTHGLRIDFSGVTASSCTTTFKWDAGTDPYVTIDGVVLDSQRPQHDITHACGLSELDVSLFVGDADPKIKIIPPSCS